MADVDVISMGQFPTVQRYLKVQVSAVELPEKVEKEKTYPFLILDGSSGVGKTQAFFPLLKDPSVQGVVFLLLVGSKRGEQAVYNEMRVLLDFDAVLRKVDELVKKKANASRNDKDDAYSVDTLRVAAQNDDETKEIVQLIQARQLTVQKATTTDADAAERSLQLVRIDKTQSLLGKVLFLDEALPAPSGASEVDIIHAEDRLRFLRNLGRALGMRVILAGTATTAVNFQVAYGSSKNPASRSEGHGDKGWAQVELLSKYAKPFPNATHQERPLIQTIFTEENMECASTDSASIERLGVALEEKKKFTDVAMLTWLTGAWLDSSQLQPSAFLLKPAELVRGHMFDPAISVAKMNSKKPDPVYTGLGSAQVLRVRGPLRVHIHRFRKWWSLMYPKSQAIQKRQASDRVEAADKTIKAEEEENERPLAALAKQASDGVEVKDKTIKAEEATMVAVSRDGKDEDALDTTPTSSKKRKQPPPDGKDEDAQPKFSKKMKWKENDKDVLVPSYTSDFRGVSGAFSHCVQACLAIEPIMATALSSCHVLTEDKFKRAISEAWNETVFQRTVGAIDGEMNEHAMFAALQLATHGERYPSTRNVVGMLCELPSYLLSRAREPDPVTIAAIRGGLEVEQVRKRNDKKLSQIVLFEKKTSSPTTDEQDGGGEPAKGMFAKERSIAFDRIKTEEEEEHSRGDDDDEDPSETMPVSPIDSTVYPEDSAETLLRLQMPWLVPAYSAGALKLKIEEAGSDLFGQVNLCGLVPGATNSLLDASAYDWKSKGKLAWRFEFRARSTSYSVQDCCKDLDAKCKKISGSSFHAMLIAVTASKKTEAAMWIEESKLRLVLAVGNGLT